MNFESNGLPGDRPLVPCHSAASAETLGGQPIAEFNMDQTILSTLESACEHCEFR